MLTARTAHSPCKGGELDHVGAHHLTTCLLGDLVRWRVFAGRSACATEFKRPGNCATYDGNYEVRRFEWVSTSARSFETGNGARHRYSSADATTPLFMPPATSTCPLGSSVAV